MKLEWYDLTCKPTDDEKVLVLNKNISPNMIQRAYYDAESDNFFSLELDPYLPLKVTHWMYLPTYEEEK
jgi:hypothetical protein